jgi:DNA repair photolyase
MGTIIICHRQDWRRGGVKECSTNFDKEREGTGTREWSESSYNIQMGCKHNCLYCYAKERALRFKQITNHEEWTLEKVREKSINRKWNKLEGIIMFPTTHDITPGNLSYVITTLRNMLVADNNILIVSKPHYDCIKAICEEFSGYKNQIMFRLTISTLNDELAKFWEPGAPTPFERFCALEYAFNHGYQTSVSMEPMLSGYAETIRTFHKAKQFVTDTVWIGKMNKARNRVDLSNPDNKFMVEQIECLQRDEAIHILVNKLKDEQKVRWKDSIKKVIQEWPEGIKGCDHV